MRTPFVILVVVVMAGCARTPIQVDVSENVYRSVETSNSTDRQIAELIIVNKAGPGRKQNTALGSDSVFPIETAPATVVTVEEDVRRYFSEHFSIDPTAKQSVRVTISDADAYWVLTSVDKIPFVGLFTSWNDTEFGLNLRVLIEIEEGGKVVSSYLYDETTTTEDKATTKEAIRNSYQNLIGAYRVQFFGELSNDFINRYF